jgi:hypothetical protein
LKNLQLSQKFLYWSNSTLPFAAGKMQTGTLRTDSISDTKPIYKMAKKVTSKEVATKASKVLQDDRYGKTSKSVAGSALSQREKKSK